MNNAEMAMAIDYSATKRELEANQKYLQKCIGAYSYINEGMPNCIILNDIKFLLDTYKLLEYCITQRSTCTPFFNITTFVRFAINAHIRLFLRVKKAIRSATGPEKIEINKLFSTIEENLKSIKEFRGSLQHGTDPLYTDYIHIRKKFPLKFQIEALLVYLKVIKLLKNQTVEADIFSRIDYPTLRQEELYKEIAQIREKVVYVFPAFTQMSYYIERYGKRTDDNTLALFDVIQKWLELNNSIAYIFPNNMQEKILNIDLYSYFSLTSFELSYQILDKIGVLLNNRLSLNIRHPNFPYFKKVIETISNTKTTLDDIETSIYIFSESPEYKLMRTIRNTIEHKDIIINFTNQNKYMSTLIIKLYTKIFLFIYLLLEEWMENKKLTFSLQAIEEANKNTRTVLL